MKKKSIIGNVLMLICSALAGVFIFKFGMKLAPVDFIKPEAIPGKGWLAAGMFLMMFFVVAVHELGHSVAGLIQGFKFYLFVVGPLGIKKNQDDKIKVYFNTDLSHFGGVTVTLPENDSPDNAKKFARLILAGPITSLIFGILCLVITGFSGGFLRTLWLVGGIFSILVFLLTTIPSKTGIFYTDRKRYQRLITPGKDQNVELAILKIFGKVNQEQSYKNIDRKDMEELTTDSNPMTQIFGLSSLMCYELETNHAITESTQSQYDSLTKNIDKNLVAAFDKSIESYRIKVLQDNPVNING